MRPRRSPLVPALLGVALAGIAGCGRQNLDLLVPSVASEGGGAQSGGADSGPTDPCSDFVTQQECEANSGFGCSFQPNVVGCRSDDPGCRPGSCGSGDPFVRRVGKTFLLNGETFRFVGVSSWALQSPRCLDFGPEERQAWVERAYDDLIPARAKVARFFAFQESAGASGNDFTLLDMSVREARRAGVRLLLVLEHRHGTCSNGDERDAAWYAGGYQQPYAGYALSYRDYARAVAERYRDEPTVLGYALLQDLGGADAATLASFVTDMGQLLHGLAPSQLIALGLSWTGDADPDGVDYRRLQALPVADFIDVQDYVFQEPPQPFDQRLIDSLAQLDKPAVIGEGAFMLTAGDDAALGARAERARQRIEVWRSAGFAGALLWAYHPGWEEVSEEFDARPADPLLQAGGVLATAPW